MSFAIERASAANIAPPVHSTGETARRCAALAPRQRRTSSAAVNRQSTRPTTRWVFKTAEASPSLRMTSNAFRGHSSQMTARESANRSQPISTAVLSATATAIRLASRRVFSRPEGNERTR